MDGLIEGRIVHYVVPNQSVESQHRAAVVTHVWNKGVGGVVNLYIFPDASYPMADLSRTSVVFSDQNAVGTWHWIEKS